MTINLDGVFGMVEMEDAANRIIEKCKARGTWHTPICYDDMEGIREQSGFLCLIYNQWLFMLVCKYQFYVKDSFIGRIGDRIDLPGTGKLEDAMKEAFPWLVCTSQQTK